MEEQTILGMCTISHLLSPKQHSMIRVVRIPYIGIYEEKAAHQGRESKCTCTRGGTYNDFQAVLGFLCHHVLGWLLTARMCTHGYI